MILSYKHKGLEAFARAGKLTGIRPGHAKRLRELLKELASVKHIGQLSQSAGLHRLYSYKGRCTPSNSIWTVRVSAQWRLLFQWDSNTGVSNLDYVNYH